MIQDKRLFEKELHQYSIRISSRAKYMRLSVSLDKGVVVVVPKAMSKHQAAKLIPEFIKDKQLWIIDSLEKLRTRKQLKPATENCELPKTISLLALKQDFTVTYVHLTGKRLILLHQNKRQLIISGDTQDRKKVFILLEKFFKTYSQPYLLQRLNQLSEQSGLSYNRLTIRAQKTRWGSCSSKKNISLNYRLIFIKKNLLDYILLHELMHTVHLNHSKAFWSSLKLLLPDARDKDNQINKITKKLPCWILSLFT
jgi:predicted metal-dependent hydrolase